MSNPYLSGESPAESAAKYADIPALQKRYRDAYTEASATVGLGSATNFVAILVGIVTAGGAIWVSSETGQGVLIAVGIVLALVVGVILYGVGVSISSGGQQLRASIDGAVNSSPFLSLQQKASVIGIALTSGKLSETPPVPTRPTSTEYLPGSETEFYVDGDVTVTDKRLSIPPDEWSISILQPVKDVVADEEDSSNYVLVVLDKGDKEVLFLKSPNREQLVDIADAINEAISSQHDDTE